jgi:hypothetical protein
MLTQGGECRGQSVANMNVVQQHCIVVAGQWGSAVSWGLRVGGVFGKGERGCRGGRVANTAAVPVPGGFWGGGGADTEFGGGGGDTAGSVCDPCSAG